MHRFFPVAKVLLVAAVAMVSAPNVIPVFAAAPS